MKNSIGKIAQKILKDLETGAWEEKFLSCTEDDFKLESPSFSYALTYTKKGIFNNLRFFGYDRSLLNLSEQEEICNAISELIFNQDKQRLAKEQKELLDKDQEFLKKHFPDLV
jgi:hypothetical protein